MPWLLSLGDTRVRDRTLPPLDGWRVNGGNEGWVGYLPLSGARGGDRFALALISLALDEVDATEVLRRHPRFGASSCRWPPGRDYECRRVPVSADADRGEGDPQP